MSGKSKSTGKAKDDFEILPDAWERFKQAVHVMAKAGPQHRIGGVAVKSGPKHKAKGVVENRPKKNYSEAEGER